MIVSYPIKPFRYRITRAMPTKLSDLEIRRAIGTLPGILKLTVDVASREAKEGMVALVTLITEFFLTFIEPVMAPFTLKVIPVIPSPTITLDPLPEMLQGPLNVTVV